MAAGVMRHASPLLVLLALLMLLLTAKASPGARAGFYLLSAADGQKSGHVMALDGEELMESLQISTKITINGDDNVVNDLQPANVILDDDVDDNMHDDDDDDDSDDEEAEVLFSSENKIVKNRKNKKNINTSAVIDDIKQVWKKSMEFPIDITNFDLNTNSNKMKKMKASGFDKLELYNHLLTQFIDPLTTSSNRFLWLDQDFLLNLKGMAMLATYPSLVKSHENVLDNHINRAVRLTSTGGGTRLIQLIISKALCRSIGAGCITLSKKKLQMIKKQCLAKAIPKQMLRTENIVSALLDLIEELDTPFVVILNDKLTWLTQSKGACDVITDEIKSNASRIFFVAIDPPDLIEEGYSSTDILKSLRSDQRNPFSSDNENNSNQGDDSKQPVEQPPSGPFTFPPGVPNGFPNAFMPPGFFPPPMGPGNSFQVTLRNGTASIAGPDGQTMPFPFPPGMPRSGKFNSNIPPEVFHKLIMEQRKKMNMNKPPNGNENGFMDGNLSAEEMQEFMKDPEVQEKMKSFLDQIVNMVASQLPPGNAPTKENPNIEVKVHMMSVPIAVNSMNGNLTPVNLPPNGRPQPNRNGLPGFFFRGARGDNLPKAQTKPNDTSVERPSDERSEVANITIFNLFDELLIAQPRDHSLRLLWDKFIEDEMSRKIAKLNMNNIKNIIVKAGLKCDEGIYDILDEVSIIRREALSTEQIKKALVIAIKLQAGLVSSSMAASTDHPLVLTLWSLDIAFNMFSKHSLPRIGKPASRTRDEISAMITDKHERSLIGNVITPQEIGVTYDMIGGLHEVKEMLRQCITYPLKYPRLYQEGIAAEAVKGVLLFGPPGTGKTLLAKAVATEGGATFMTIDASTIENKWLGESEKNARAVFTLARRLAPCVIYLDEVDSVLSSREHGDDSSHGTLTSVKTTLMQEWDGLRTTKDRVVVIASTNRPFDLDEAVLRRLPRRIMVDLPDSKTREEILSVSLMGNRIDPEANLTTIAEMLDGYSGSDIKEVCREAVVRIAHERAKIFEEGIHDRKSHDSPFTLRPVTLEDFKMAMQKLKASVDDSGREMSKVVEWNEKYGEIKKKNDRRGSATHFSMYI